MFDVIIGSRTWCGMRIESGKEIKGGIGERMGNSEGRIWRVGREGNR